MILPSFYLFFYHTNYLLLNIYGTEWPMLCWCAVKKLLGTYSHTHQTIEQSDSYRESFSICPIVICTSCAVVLIGCIMCLARPSVRRSVCRVELRTWKHKSVEKKQIRCANVPRCWSNRCANFQLNGQRSRSQGHRKSKSSRSWRVFRQCLRASPDTPAAALSSGIAGPLAAP